MDLREKLDYLSSLDLEDVAIISDFDGTLSKGYVDSKRAPNSISVFRDLGFVGEDYVKQTKAFFEYYHPKEKDPNLDSDKKFQLMVEWWTKHFEVLKKYGITQSTINEVVLKNEVPLRNYFEDFFSYVHKTKIETVIFSAGTYDVIKGILDRENSNHSNVHLIANEWEYNEKGEFIGTKGDVIHSLNKTCEVIKNKNFFESLSSKKLIVLLGDSLSDLKMAQGLGDVLTLSIGFFNLPQSDDHYSDSLEKFKEVYDIVLEGDNGLDQVLNFLT